MKTTKPYYLIVLVLWLFISCETKNKQSEPPNKEVSNEWIELFNGKDLNDWVVKINGYPLSKDTLKTFRVKNGVIKVSYDEYDKFADRYGHLFYKDSFSNYRLKLEYRFIGNQVSDGPSWALKNSGVMLHSQSPQSMGLHQEFPVSMEAQFLGGVDVNKERPTGNLCTPGTHVVMEDVLIEEHCINSKSETIYDDQWVAAEMLVLNDSLISHSINGKEVIRYSKPVIGGEYVPDTEDWKSKVAKPLKKGYIALQSESHPIEFRNIKLQRLN